MVDLTRDGSWIASWVLRRGRGGGPFGYFLGQLGQPFLFVAQTFERLGVRRLTGEALLNRLLPLPHQLELGQQQWVARRRRIAGLTLAARLLLRGLLWVVGLGRGLLERVGELREPLDGLALRLLR